MSIEILNNFQVIVQIQEVSFVKSVKLHSYSIAFSVMTKNKYIVENDKIQQSRTTKTSPYSVGDVPSKCMGHII